jgi:hypothetical protein
MLKRFLQTALVVGALGFAASGCGHSCRSAEDCYSEVVASDTVAKFGGGTAAVVGRISQSGHPFSIAVRFSHVDYAGLAQAPAQSMDLLVPQPLTKFYKAVSATLIAPGPNARFEVAFTRHEGDVVHLSVPIGVLAPPSSGAAAAVSGELKRGKGANEGWFPQRYCVSYAPASASGDRGPSTTIGIDRFALPGGEPFPSAGAGIPNDVYGC